MLFSHGGVFLISRRLRTCIAQVSVHIAVKFEIFGKHA